MPWSLSVEMVISRGRLCGVSLLLGVPACGGRATFMFTHTASLFCVESERCDMWLIRASRGTPVEEPTGDAIYQTGGATEAVRRGVGVDPRSARGPARRARRGARYRPPLGWHVDTLVGGFPVPWTLGGTTLKRQRTGLLLRSVGVTVSNSKIRK